VLNVLEIFSILRFETFDVISVEGLDSDVAVVDVVVVVRGLSIPGSAVCDDDSGAY